MKRKYESGECGSHSSLSADHQQHLAYLQSLQPADADKENIPPGQTNKAATASAKKAAKKAAAAAPSSASTSAGPSPPSSAPAKGRKRKAAPAHTEESVTPLPPAPSAAPLSAAAAPKTPTRTSARASARASAAAAAAAAEGTREEVEALLRTPPSQAAAAARARRASAARSAKAPAAASSAAKGKRGANKGAAANANDDNDDDAAMKDDEEGSDAGASSTDDDVDDDLLAPPAVSLTLAPPSPAFMLGMSTLPSLAPPSPGGLGFLGSMGVGSPAHSGHGHGHFGTHGQFAGAAGVNGLTFSPSPYASSALGMSRTPGFPSSAAASPATTRALTGARRSALTALSGLLDGGAGATAQTPLGLQSRAAAAAAAGAGQHTPLRARMAGGAGGSSSRSAAALAQRQSGPGSAMQTPVRPGGGATAVGVSSPPNRALRMRGQSSGGSALDSSMDSSLSPSGGGALNMSTSSLTPSSASVGCDSSLSAGGSPIPLHGLRLFSPAAAHMHMFLSDSSPGPVPADGLAGGAAIGEDCRDAEGSSRKRQRKLAVAGSATPAEREAQVAAANRALAMGPAGSAALGATASPGGMVPGSPMDFLRSPVRGGGGGGLRGRKGLGGIFDSMHVEGAAQSGAPTATATPGRLLSVPDSPSSLFAAFGSPARPHARAAANGSASSHMLNVPHMSMFSGGSMPLPPQTPRTPAHAVGRTAKMAAESGSPFPATDGATAAGGPSSALSASILMPPPSFASPPSKRGRSAMAMLQAPGSALRAVPLHRSAPTASTAAAVAAPSSPPLVSVQHTPMLPRHFPALAEAAVPNGHASAGTAAAQPAVSPPATQHSLNALASKHAHSQQDQPAALADMMVE